ncbi:MAG: hypothetical protein ACLPVY_15240 [Acidimicrobiia bacterium]
MEQVVISRLTESSPETVEQINRLIPQLKPAWDPITPARLDAQIKSPTRVYVARYDNVVVE